MIIIEGCAIATVDADRTEYADGHVVIDDGRIVAVGPGYAGHYDDSARRVDGTGCLATPGLVNTHHHLYQWATRGLAQQENLFGWLTELYPIWAGLDADLVAATTGAGLGWLALSGCTTSTDHHYVHPAGSGDLMAAQVEAAREVGLRFHPCRGSMDLGQSQGGLPPDHVVEDLDVALAGTEEAIDRFHDPADGAMVRVAVAPCSPFSVTAKLMTEAAELARRKGVRLHTHLAETVEEEEYCQRVHGCTPAEYAERLGWLGDDVWLAHAVHLDDAAVSRLAATGTGVAHCPSSNARLGAGIAPVRDLLDAGAPVGLGVDGPASQEANHLGAELRQALYAARLRGGPAALTAREALALATVGGARCLGRADELGSLEIGKLADVALWRLDGLGHVGMDDPVAALVLGPPAALQLLLVGGRPVVERGELRTVDERELVRRARRAQRTLMRRAQR
ncbi:cytosine/adenosine deaminase-related metal-dependent hydrolase [Micromonospora kangleipakensis]|uniref:Cytosine/adenosine deaminase-related metal-dependent hydrolase n=1 Tax=Micromonospora kangleipakensis TaxID=1077942 RepID=A0A4Q8BFL6_9ACTN|nr:8-oxoguanine deaminase [Micromonospora kangleipakensis]RZU76767.1 cytosine/adenosine deaminase-related metal-dependent hydrolase [Micromonospora kangleipakensis]